MIKTIFYLIPLLAECFCLNEKQYGFVDEAPHKNNIFGVNNYESQLNILAFTECYENNEMCWNASL